MKPLTGSKRCIQAYHDTLLRHAILYSHAEMLMYYNIGEILFIFNFLRNRWEPSKVSSLVTQQSMLREKNI